MEKYVLAIETATKLCSVGLSKNGELVALKEIHDEKYTHAENLHPFINTVLGEAEITADKLSAVSVSKGPGSYTGLRIGVSAAKGLCYALNIPLIGVETLDVIGEAIKDNGDWDEDAVICPVIDARRMEVFTKWMDRTGKEMKPVHAAIIEADEILIWNNKNRIIGGDGAEKLKEILTEAVILQDILPSASYQLKLAHKKYEAQDFESTAYFEPYYLKDFIAGKPKSML